MLSSVHKLVGCLTQSAILHLGEGDRVDERIVDRAVTLIESTSPSAILTASLDAARRQAATRGEELLAETVDSLAVLRERIRGSRAGSTSSTSGSSVAPASTPTTRCGSWSTSAGPARPGTGSLG